MKTLNPGCSGLMFSLVVQANIGQGTLYLFDIDGSTVEKFFGFELLGFCTRRGLHVSLARFDYEKEDDHRFAFDFLGLGGLFKYFTGKV